eukprot:4430327-Amphidinium_carterae.1
MSFSPSLDLPGLVPLERLILEQMLDGLRLLLELVRFLHCVTHSSYTDSNSSCNLNVTNDLLWEVNWNSGLLVLRGSETSPR